MALVNITEQTFESTVESGIVLIDWWATWCAPCRAFAPIYEAVAQNHPDLTFAKVNTEEEPGLAGAFRIHAIPTLMVFRDNVLVFEQPGLLPAQALEDLIRQVRELDMDKVRADIEAQLAEQPPADETS